jgi:hypothetical protein
MKEKLKKNEACFPEVLTIFRENQTKAMLCLRFLAWHIKQTEMAVAINKGINK